RKKQPEKSEETPKTQLGKFSVWIAEKTHVAKAFCVPKAILLRNKALELWSKLPPAKWLRASIAAAAAALLLSLPAMAILGGKSNSDLKLPAEKAPVPEFDDKVLSVIQGTPEGKISLGDGRKEVFVVFSHPVVPLATLDEV